jgi:uncharacterized tellurite resistance protein B-like protein
MEITNTERCDLANLMIEAADFDDEDLRTNIIDAVADLLHLASENDIEPGPVVKMAMIHVDAETGRSADF